MVGAMYAAVVGRLGVSWVVLSPKLLPAPLMQLVTMPASLGNRHTPPGRSPHQWSPWHACGTANTCAGNATPGSTLATATGARTNLEQLVGKAACLYLAPEEAVHQPGGIPDAPRGLLPELRPQLQGLTSVGFTKTLSFQDRLGQLRSRYVRQALLESDAGTQFPQRLRIAKLVAVNWGNDRGNAGPQHRLRGPSAAVVNHATAARKQPVVWCFRDEADTLRCKIRQLGLRRKRQQGAPNIQAVQKPI
mmetsp:Transcript_37555/g.107762  ORF Transcript_37555/g.107762 Transcript_37555/m.107762 type:complete len:248 (-) Transcript_37555:1398-2141(-)